MSNCWVLSNTSPMLKFRIELRLRYRFVAVLDGQSTREKMLDKTSLF